MPRTSPGPTLGVIGGGQLGRMLGEAAGPLGVEVVVVDPTARAPASPVVRDQLVGDFDDHEVLRELAERSDYLTYEIELADPDVLESVGEATDTPVHPRPETLRTIQDKFVQKERLSAAGVPVPAFRAVDSIEELHEALADLGYPAMLKARTGGYDGRGNVPIRDPDEVQSAFDAIDGPAMVEEFVEYERELAVIGCRGTAERDTFPVTETIHEAEILRETVAPARTSAGACERARAVARAALDALSGRGVFGIELFEVRDGGDSEIILNEIAPRPHNSGHWTIEGCVTSQFEQHVRAVTGLPLGSTERRTPTVTANVLGDVDADETATLYGFEDALRTDRLSAHWYGKRDVYPLRKMAHLTLTGTQDADVSNLLSRIRAVRDELTFEPP